MSTTLSTQYAYENWPSGHPYDWAPATKGDHDHDQFDFHVDLGCGRVKKARIGVDHMEDPAVDIVLDFEQAWLPFADDSIESMVSHHCLEHIDDGFIGLMDECYRVLKPDALFRIIVPIFPSWSAVSDPDHRRYFMATDNPQGHGTFDNFCGEPGKDNFLGSFSVPYTKARFRKVAQSVTPRPLNMNDWWTERDAREIRITLAATK